MSQLKLSIFIDESGDTGGARKNNDFYIVSFIIHEQKTKIGEEIIKLNRGLSNLHFNSDKPFHTGPLIRNEKEYSTISLKVRIKLFRCFFNFAKLLDFSYFSIIIKKNDEKDNLSQIDNEIKNRLDEIISRYIFKLKKYSDIVIYYDDGQKHLSSTISKCIKEWTQFNFVFKSKSAQSHYKLLQLADFVATLELLNAKEEFSKSEKMFFTTKRLFYKNYYKLLSKKKIDE